MRSIRIRQLHGTIDFERNRNAKLFEENQRLKRELEQVKLELKLERQNKFATNQQQHEEEKSTVLSESTSSGGDSPWPKKRGAPVGHPGWFRPAPTHYNCVVDVAAPCRCPDCQGQVTYHASLDPAEYLQEDIIDGVYRVVLYRHAAACCADCGAWVEHKRVKARFSVAVLARIYGARLFSYATGSASGTARFSKYSKKCSASRSQPHDAKSLAICGTGKLPSLCWSLLCASAMDVRIDTFSCRW